MSRTILKTNSPGIKKTSTATQSIAMMKDKFKDQLEMSQKYSTQVKLNSTNIWKTSDLEKLNKPLIIKQSLAPLVMDLTLSTLELFIKSIQTAKWKMQMSCKTTIACWLLKTSATINWVRLRCLRCSFWKGKINRNGSSGLPKIKCKKATWTSMIKSSTLLNFRPTSMSFTIEQMLKPTLKRDSSTKQRINGLKKISLKRSQVSLFFSTKRKRKRLCKKHKMLKRNCLRLLKVVNLNLNAP